MQRLNLYSQLDHITEPPFSARQQSRVLMVVIVLMLLVYGGLLLRGQGHQAELQQAQQQQANVQAALDTLNAEKARQLNNTALDDEIAKLTREISFRRRLLATVEPESQADAGGFTGHMQGLARQHIDGVWFTSIELLEGGSELAIAGQTRLPELVPRYIRRLADERVFHGHQFKIFRLYTPEEDGSALNFELRANELGL